MKKIILFLLIVASLSLYGQVNDTVVLYNKSLVFFKFLNEENIKGLLEIHRNSDGPKYADELYIERLVTRYKPWIESKSIPKLDEVSVIRHEKTIPIDIEFGRDKEVYVIEYKLSFKFDSDDLGKDYKFIFHYHKVWEGKEQAPKTYKLEYIDYEE